MPPTNSYWTSSTQGVVITSKLVIDTDCPGSNCFFTYAAQSSSPKITGLATSALSGKGTLLITGINFNAVNSSNVQIVLQNNITGVKTIAIVNSVTNTVINFTVPNVQAGPYSVRARLDPIG